MNILSIGEIIDRCIYIEIKKYERSLVLQLTSGGPVYVFKRVNNQFICNLSSDVVKNVDNNRNNKYSYKHIGVAMVEERNKLFSRAELSRADEARQLQQRMGYPSAGQLIKQIQHGKIDTRVSATDIVNSVYIYGKSIGECNGKTTAAKPEPEADVPIPFAGVPVFQTVYIDLMFENGLVFIIVVCKPLNYTFVGLVKSRKAKDI